MASTDFKVSASEGFRSLQFGQRLVVCLEHSSIELSAGLCSCPELPHLLLLLPLLDIEILEQVIMIQIKISKAFEGCFDDGLGNQWRPEVLLVSNESGKSVETYHLEVVLLLDACLDAALYGIYQGWGEMNALPSFMLSRHEVHQLKYA